MGPGDMIIQSTKDITILQSLLKFKAMVLKMPINEMQGRNSES